MRQREAHDHCSRATHSRLRPDLPSWSARGCLPVPLPRRRRPRRGGGDRPVRPFARRSGRGRPGGEHGRRCRRRAASAPSRQRYRRPCRRSRRPHRHQRRPGLAGGAAPGRSAGVGTARDAVRPRPPGRGPRRRPRHSRPSRSSRPGLLHRHGGGARRPLDHPARHRTATAADHLRTGHRGCRRRRRGEGGPSRGSAGTGTVPLRGRLPALGSAAGRDLSRSAVPASRRPARPRSGTTAAGLRRPRAGRRTNADRITDAGRITATRSAGRRGDHG